MPRPPIFSRHALHPCPPRCRLALCPLPPRSLPGYGAAVIIAHATGNADQFTINFWALLFVASRIAFIYCYINDKATLRSAMFGVNLLCIVALFIAAI